jgi:glycosyltransferase involved in cell wall biosynthesis
MTYTVVYYIDSDNFGGAEKVLFNLIKGLDRKTWQPALAYHPAAGISNFIDQIRELDVETIPVPVIGGYEDLKNMRRFTKIVAERRPDIFHANLNWPLACSYGIISAFLARAKTIIATQHLYEKIGSRRYDLMQKVVSLLVNRYIAVSNDVSAQLKRDIPFGGKVDVVHNGICINAFEERESENFERILPGIASDRGNRKPVVLTVGRLVKQKGHRYLLRAIAKVPGADFVFAGDGPERKDIEKEIGSLGIGGRVHLLGHRDDIPELLGSCDIFVLPSLFEGHPLSIMEAMAARKPVVASNIRGVDEIITSGETGCLVPPANPDALAAAIQGLIDDPDKANEMASAGNKKVAAEFSSSVMVKNTTAIYLEFMTGRRHKD